MQRRKFILGLGATAASGATVLGSGAFTSVEADRDITVEVADDAYAFLALKSTSHYAVDDGGTLAIDLSPDNPTDAGGQGVNARADTVIYEVFKIENQGTQDVGITFTGENADQEGPSLTLADEDSGMTVEISPEDNAVLSPGDSVAYSLVIDAFGAEPGDSLDQTITVEAEATE